MGTNKELIKQAINNQLINQSINQARNQSNKHAINHSINQSTNQSSNQSINQVCPGVVIDFRNRTFVGCGSWGSLGLGASGAINSKSELKHAPIKIIARPIFPEKFNVLLQLTTCSLVNHNMVSTRSLILRLSGEHESPPWVRRQKWGAGF